MVALSFIAGSLLAAVQLTSAAPQTSSTDGHQSPKCCKQQRMPWQRLSKEQQQAYISATQCLTTTPARLNIPGLKTRWDEFQYIHAYSTAYIHLVGQFFPFHRYFVKIHEKALQDDCNYWGPMPYWDEPNDAASFPNVAVFDPTTGFGGNGSSTDHCVRDGPFANLTLRVNRDLSTSDHCLTRNFNTCSFKFAVQANVDECQAKTTYQTWRTCTEAIPHASGHGGVGALMQSVPLSPGDPIFWLHHTYLDKLWHDWQQADPATRTYAIGGSNQFLTDPALQGGDNGALFLVENGTMNVFMPPGANQTKIVASYCGVFQPNIVFPSQPQFVNYFGDGGNVTTLNHTLSTLGLYPNATANDVMDLSGDFVCAEYV